MTVSCFFSAAQTTKLSDPRQVSPDRVKQLIDNNNLVVDVLCLVSRYGHLKMNEAVNSKKGSSTHTSTDFEGFSLQNTKRE